MRSKRDVVMMRDVWNKELIAGDSCQNSVHWQSSLDELMQQGKILNIDIRRKYFIKDCLREGEKAKFDPQKIIKVCTCRHVCVLQLIMCKAQQVDASMPVS